MSDTTTGIVVGLTCGVVIFFLDKAGGYIAGRKSAFREFKDTFSALLVVFDDNCFGFPLGAQEFLADVYHVQLKVMLRAKSYLLCPAKKRAMQKAWDNYYKYIANNHFASWLDSKNRIDPANTAEGYFSLLKRGINGTFHHVSKQHLERYLKEFDFRKSRQTRKGTDNAEPLRWHILPALEGHMPKRKVRLLGYYAFGWVRHT